MFFFFFYSTLYLFISYLKHFEFLCCWKVLYIDTFLSSNVFNAWLQTKLSSGKYLGRSFLLILSWLAMGIVFNRHLKILFLQTGLLLMLCAAVCVVCAPFFSLTQCSLQKETILLNLIFTSPFMHSLLLHSPFLRTGKEKGKKKKDSTETWGYLYL